MAFKDCKITVKKDLRDGMHQKSCSFSGANHEEIKSSIRPKSWQDPTQEMIVSIMNNSM